MSTFFQGSIQTVLYLNIAAMKEVQVGNAGIILDTGECENSIRSRLRSYCLAKLDGLERKALDLLLQSAEVM